MTAKAYIQVFAAVKAEPSVGTCDDDRLALQVRLRKDWSLQDLAGEELSYLSERWHLCLDCRGLCTCIDLFWMLLGVESFLMGCF